MVTIRTAEEFTAHILNAPSHKTLPPMEEKQLKQGSVHVTTKRYSIKVKSVQVHRPEGKSNYVEIRYEFAKDEDQEAFGPWTIMDHYTLPPNVHWKETQLNCMRKWKQVKALDQLVGSWFSAKLKLSKFETDFGEANGLQVYNLKEWADPDG